MSSVEKAKFYSLWEQTAEPAPKLCTDAETQQPYDVLVIGAGITGLSMALHSAECGASVCVLDAHEPGWGASGRSGGQVIPIIKHDPKEILRRYGNKAGNELLMMVGQSADTVFDLIERYQIECNALRAGWVQPAHSQVALDEIRNRAQQWEALGAKVEVLDRKQVSAILGTDKYLGGWKDSRAGSVHPLNYTRGLLKVALSLGVSVSANSEVVNLRKNTQGYWLATIKNGRQVKASHVVIATNGYTNDLWPNLRQSIISANSFVIATGRLPEPIANSILKGGEVASDSRRLLIYFRKDAEGRFVVGGRGKFDEPQKPQDWAHLERAAYNLYPQLSGIPFKYRWAGRIALTKDYMPHVHEPKENLTILLGYNGRGIALGTQLGRYLAHYIIKGEKLPFPITKINTIPFHSLRRLYLSLGILYFRFLDYIR